MTESKATEAGFIAGSSDGGRREPLLDPTQQRENERQAPWRDHEQGHWTQQEGRSMRPMQRIAELGERKFDVRTLPEDVARVYGHLERKWGEEYGLLFVFQMRTAAELHRAWHMTLYTSNILQRVKDRFGLRMTWNLGVVQLKFRVEDGGHELHRKVPYDYDSEYQDVYYRIAMALVNGHINVHEALIYQTEAKQGLHTAASGLFLRDPPGRLILYPFQAATCAVIFFNGRWLDAGVAAITGLSAGVVESALSLCSGKYGVAKVLTDVVVGLATGIVGGLYYTYASPFCLSSVFMGTLYWFFYGTAFVIGILEIIAGELETGVTRFVAVSVKTFVLSLGASVGLMISHQGGAMKVWFESEDYCDKDFVQGEWFRIPVYLLCCVAVLGQYRMPLDKYVLGMAVQLAAYEAQYEVHRGINEQFTMDHLDTAASNMAGAAAGVLVTFALVWIINACRRIYSAQLLNIVESPSLVDRVVYHVMRFFVRMHCCLGIGRKSDARKLDMERTLREQKERLRDPSDPLDRIRLGEEDEHLFLETIVGAQGINPWSVLMPAVYQLVPGSVIARLWFHSIFPPPRTDSSSESPYDSAFSNLMVISTSLSLGLIFGFAIVQIFLFCIIRLSRLACRKDDERMYKLECAQDEMGMCYTDTAGDKLDPGSIRMTESNQDTISVPE